MSDALPLVGAGAVPWLSVEQIREVDRIMVDELGISLVRMMENAGRNLAEVARHLLGGDSSGRSIVVLAGPGGNGGGGLVAARHLAVAGAQVGIALDATVGGLAPVPAEQLEIARRLAFRSTSGRTGWASRSSSSTRCSATASAANRMARRSS